MTSKRMMLAGCALAMLAGCAGEAPAPTKVEKAAALKPGEYEVTQTVSALSGKDGGAPRTALKLNQVTVVRACVSGDALPEAMFAEAGDACETKNSYVRSGKLNVQLACTRKGTTGPIVPGIDGAFEAERFDATVRSATYFAGEGDYVMTQKVTGARVGDCPASDTTASKEGKADKAA